MSKGEEQRQENQSNNATRSLSYELSPRSGATTRRGTTTKSLLVIELSLESTEDKSRPHNRFRESVIRGTIDRERELL